MSDDASGCLGVVAVGAAVAIFLVWNHFRQLHQKTSAEVVTLRAQITSLRSQVAQLKKNASSGRWVLWYSETGLNSLYRSGITPTSAYPTKKVCLGAAKGWSLPGAKIMGLDPYIIENKTYRVTYRCLPRGVTPYAGR